MKKASIPASLDLYSVELSKTKLVQNATQVVASLQDTFRVDDLDNLPVTTGLSTVSVAGDQQFVAGIPGYKNGFTVTTHVLAQHLGRYYVRSDKQVELSLRFSDNPDESCSNDVSFVSDQEHWNDDGDNLIDTTDPIGTDNRRLNSVNAFDIPRSPTGIFYRLDAIGGGAVRAAQPPGSGADTQHV